MTQPDHIYFDFRQRLAFIYALLIGVVGVLTLVWLLQYQTASFDLLALLAFTLLSIIVSYFRIPIGPDSAELSVDGTILLGAMLTGGPVIGGWAAFITGLVLSIHPQAKRLTAPLSWVEQAALSALNSGRNVIAIGAAWVIFYWLGGTLNPARFKPTIILALLLMCIVYILTRLLIVWLLGIFVGSRLLQSFFMTVNADQFLIELLPLPLALAFSPFFVRFTWTRFLILALLFIGNGMLLYQLTRQIQHAQNQIETLRMRQKIEQALADLASSTGTLCSLAHRFCQEIVQAYCEIGIFNAALSQVQVAISSDVQTSQPSMYIPMTALWAWIGNLNRPQVLSVPEELDTLPFPLPRLPKGTSARSALLIPICDPKSAVEKPTHIPLGGILLLSESPQAFDPTIVERLTVLADLIGVTLRRMRDDSLVAIEMEQEEVVRYIQQTLLPAQPPLLPGWQIGCAWTLSSHPNGVWFDWQLNDGPWSFCLSEPTSQGLRSVLLSTVVRAVAATMPPQERHIPAQFMHRLNAYLLGFSQRVRFIHILNDQDHLLTWANAGYPPVLWWHSAQERIEVMPSTTPELGTDPEAETETTTVAMEEGDALVVYTRGVIDACYEQIPFQEKRLLDVIRESAQLSADALAQTIIAHVQAFVQNEPLEQDALVIVFKATSG